MPEEPAHAVTLRLLDALGQVIADERRVSLLAHRQRVERLTEVHDDESARKAAQELLRDALSV
jgi:hypothetical protein